MKLSKVPDRKDLGRHARRVLRDGEVVGVIFIDLDGFKAVNDINGHLAGDRCLQKVVSILSKFEDSRTSLFRYGGDEFVIFVEGSKDKKLAHLAESVRKSIERGRPGGSVNVTASIGIAEGGRSIRRIDKLLLMADEAAYVSKFRRKNCVTAWPIPLELRNGARERRIEEVFAARHKEVLLRARETTEAARQMFFHVLHLYPTWRRSAETRIAIETLSSPSLDDFIKAALINGSDFWTMEGPGGETDRERAIRDQFERYKDECSKDGVERAVCYVGSCSSIFVRERLLHLMNILQEVNHSPNANASSQRLKQLHEVCDAVFKTLIACNALYSGTDRGPKGTDHERNWYELVIQSEKICAEASTLIASFLPEMRAI